MRIRLTLLLVIAAPVLAAPAAPPADPVPATAELPVAPQDPALDEVIALARGNAADLALALMDQRQGEFAAAPARWERWEVERLHVLGTRRDWTIIEERTRELPAAASAAFRSAALTARIDALLELGQAGEARRLLRELIWAAEATPDPASVDRWRRQLIQGYVGDGLVDDAATAIQRRRQDDPREAARWVPVEAALLLRAGQPRQAITALAGRRDALAQALNLAAGLRTRELTSAAVFDAAVKLAVAKVTPDEVRGVCWLVAAEAADAHGNAPARIAALERALTAPRSVTLPAGVFESGAGEVWEAYLAHGSRLGNSLQLVIGSDADWFAAAEARFDAEPVAARALYSVVTQRGAEAASREQAHWQFARLIAREPNGGELLAALYLERTRYPEPEAVPAPVRYLLIDGVLARPDIPLASRLLAGLSEPPSGADPAEWHLRRARVFVLAGDTKAGLRALDELIASGEPFEVDRLLQVVFDLQTLEEHRGALRFLTPLLEWELPPQRRRELLFWTADSHAALANHVEAARLYLASALLLDPVAMDPWAQTARYQAANALAKARLWADARRQYASLLGATQDPARQAVLRHELQQLVLEEGRAGHTP